MENSLITQCPECGTRFRVTAEQLGIARGLVRCGSCLQVFAAVQNMAADGHREPSRPATASGPQTGDRIPASPQLELDQLDLTGDLAEQSGDGDGDGEWAMDAGADVSGAVAEPLDLEAEADTGEDLAMEAGEPADCLPADPIDIDPSLDEPPVGGFAIAAASADVATLNDYAITDEERHRLFSSLSIRPDAELPARPVARPASKWIGWLAGNLVLLMLLLIQYAWVNRDTLARREELRPYYEWVCAGLQCQLPDFVALDRIVTRGLVIRSHPDVKDALVVDAIIYNDAAHAQPFPMLDLGFSDLDGKPLASRRFRPDEYLAGELATYTSIPGRTEVHISLEIVDPGPAAVSYQLQVVGI